MDHGFPDASEEDLARADHVCIVCREEMAVGGRNKKLACSHCFHLHCLRCECARRLYRKRQRFRSAFCARYERRC